MKKAEQIYNEIMALRREDAIKILAAWENQIWNSGVDETIKKAGVIPVKKMENFDEVTDYEVNTEVLEKLKRQSSLNNC